MIIVDGVTRERKLDGTEHEISGGDVIGKNDELTLHGGGYKHTVTPAIGAPTDTTFNAAAAVNVNTYADVELFIAY